MTKTTHYHRKISMLTNGTAFKATWLSTLILQKQRLHPCGILHYNSARPARHAPEGIFNFMHSLRVKTHTPEGNRSTYKHKIKNNQHQDKSMKHCTRHNSASITTPHNALITQHNFTQRSTQLRKSAAATPDASVDPTPIWLTEKQVALLTSLSVSTLRNHRQRRMGIPYVKLGRSVRYALRAVEEYMNAHAITY
jgi:predicted DNA-binding transcriptional regulator AlpA